MGASGGTDEDRPSLPVDLVLTAALALVVLVGALVPALGDSSLRYGLAIVALYLPGYALVAALFPRGPLEEGQIAETLLDRHGRLDGFERAVLSAATGLVATPLVGIGVEASPLAYRQEPVVATLTATVLLATAVAAYRRRQLPAAERYTPGRRWRRALGDVARGRPSTSASLLTVVVALSILVAAGGVLSVAITVDSGESYTELSLSTAQDDTLVAGDYPRSVTAGSPVSVVVGIENNEGTTQRYTVATRLERVTEADGETSVVAVESFEPVTVTVEDGASRRIDHQVVPTATGEDLRLAVYLYRGDVPDQIGAATAYRSTHLWVTVEP